MTPEELKRLKEQNERFNNILQDAPASGTTPAATRPLIDNSEQPLRTTINTDVNLDNNDTGTPINLPPNSKPVGTSSNPLSKYFRSQGVHVRLPSRGVWGPAGIEMAATGEVTVLSMRARDELLLKNPDALLNGSAIERIIQNCVPGVTSIVDMPSVDVDVLMIAIRISSTGNRMEIETQCPNCNHEQNYEIDISFMLNPSRMKYLKDQYIAEWQGLKIHLRPQTYQDAVRLSLITFEESNALKKLQNINDENQRIKAFGSSFSKIAELNFEIVSNCITAIETPEGETITDHQIIYEFVTSVDRQGYQAIDQVMAEMSQAGIDRSVEITCTNCNNKWNTEVSIDPANFFGIDYKKGRGKK